MSAPSMAVPAPAKSTGGVLAINAAATAQHQTNGSNKSQAKNATARLKVLIRRLPPGITQAEVQNILGEAWTVGKGKVDWVSFKPGKASKDQAKPSHPARLYLQVTNAAHLEPLSETVRTSTFTDARNTSSDPVLLGPPILEFAPLQRVPTGKRRNDARQGTIDQDPEFMEFLESLISPITKQVDTTDDAPAVKVTTTPLIQHLRDKKAAKEAAKQKKEKEKSTKQAPQASKDVADSKTETVAAAAKTKDVPNAIAATNASPKKGGRPAKAEKAVKAQTSPQKVMKKETPSVQAKAQPQQPAVAPAAPTTSTTSNATSVPSTPATNQQAAPNRRPEINSAAAAARMLQRDLGIRGGRGGTLPRRGGRPTQEATPATQTNTTSNPASASQSPKPSAATTNTPTTRSTSAAQPQPNATAGSVKRPPPTQPTTPQPPAATKPPPSTQPTQQPPPSRPLPPLPSSPHGFLKHANPSQGITEALLHTALSPFGTVIKVEIDKRKGFAYVEYADAVALQKAIGASPIKVAQGAVQVLERKDRGGASAGGIAGSVVSSAKSSVPVSGAGVPQAPRGSANAGANVNVPGRQQQAMFQPGRTARGRGAGAAAHGGILHATHAPCAAPVAATATASPATATAAAKAPVKENIVPAKADDAKPASQASLSATQQSAAAASAAPAAAAPANPAQPG